MHPKPQLSLPAAMAYIPVESLLWSRRRSRCARAVGAHVANAEAGKRCAPGRADAGKCGGLPAGLRDPQTELTRAPRESRRLNKTVRAVCRLWWRGPDRHDGQQAGAAPEAFLG
jgi:hypothetical protein